MLGRGDTLRLVTMTLAITCGALGLLTPDWRTALRAQTYYYECDHGLDVMKSCDGPKRSCATDADCTDGDACTEDVCDPSIGNTADCSITATHADTCGDTTKISGAFDEEDFGGDDVRIPAVGNLPIESLAGNVACCAGPALPCFVGPANSAALIPDASTGCGDMLLPGVPEAGRVVFRQAQYTISPSDPDPVPDRATVEHGDVCDAQPEGCDAASAITTAAATTDVVTGCLHEASPAGTTCPDTDDDHCTLPACNGAGTCAQTYDAVTCGNPACRACDPADGACKPIDDAPATCALLPHFQCFETHRPPIVTPNLDLVDRFGASTVALIRAKRLCAPADKNGEDPGVDLNGTHLSEYMIDQVSPPFERIRELEVTDQFSTLHVDLVRPDRILVPTTKSLTSTPPDAPTDLDHLKCYKVKGGRLRVKDLDVRTQFASLRLDIKRPVHLCVAAARGAGDIQRPDAAFMCYQTRPAASRPIFRGPDVVYTTSQVESDAFGIFGPRELCVPATLP